MVDCGCPLSFAQQRLWLLHQLAPGSGQYHISLPLRLTGLLDVGALRTALTAVVARHEPLRSTYPVTDGTAVQRIHPPATVAMPLVDLSGLAGAERPAELARRSAAAQAQPFDLASGPVLRATLFRLTGTEHVLLLVVHHIAFDGWSTGILLRELSTGYQAAVRGEVARFAPLPTRYTEFAARQRQRLATGELDKALSYWRQQLAGTPPLRLPIDQPVSTAGAAGAAAAGDHEFCIPAEVTRRLVDVGRRYDATLFMVLVAATQALLSWYCGSGDIAVGTVVSGRDRVEVEPLIGLFVNTLVLRCQVDDELPFTALLAQARDTVLDAFAHAEVPFERVVELVRPQRAANRMPLAQAMVVLQNAPEYDEQRPGLRIEDIHGMAATDPQAQFDIQLQFQQRDGQLAGTLSYQRGRFEPASAARLARHLAALLAGVASSPNRPLWRLWPVRGLTHLQLLQQAEPVPHPGQGGTTPGRATAGEQARVSLPELFARQVRQHPDRPAVQAAGTALTYRQLDQRADRLAAHLRARGLRRGERVCTLLRSGVDAVTSFVALAKLGVSYACLEPGMPPQRVRLVLQDSRPALVLTGPGSGAVADLDGVEVWRVEDGLGHLEAPAPATGPGPDDPLCTIYTSGSTGRPKGVVLTHHNLANLIAWHGQVLGGAAGDRFGQVASLSFDASVWEIWSALCLGACVCVADPALRRDARALGRWIVDEGLHLCFLTTSVGEHVLRSGALAGAQQLRHLLIGGEKAGTPPAGLPFALLNVYGPTESAVLATWFDMSGWALTGHGASGAGGPGGPPAPPIGRPLTNIRAYVLDRRLQPVPPGRVAELYLGGDGVAQGYLGQQALTAERFVADPFGPPGTRMYRTGDLVSVSAGGLLEFHGRLDRQIKIRGHRVELDEVEQVLRRHDQVTDAAVVCVPDAGGQPVVLAYFTTDCPQPADPAELRSWLRQHLPEAMLPAQLVALAALPRTPSGKTDLRALAGRVARPAPARAAGAPPRTGTERTVWQEWSDLLGVGELGIHDNFFDVGGSSITLLELRARLEPHYGGELPIALLFEHTTIAAMARLLDRRGTRASTTDRATEGWDSAGRHIAAGTGAAGTAGGTAREGDYQL